jgi:hypothetical protein
MDKTKIIWTLVIVLVASLIWASYWYWPQEAGLYTPETGVYKNWKTLWDWMELLIIPAVLAGGAILLNRAQRQSEQAIAKDREEERTLRDYFSAMTDLLLNHNLRDGAGEYTESHSIAKARTLAILRSFEGETLESQIRKGSVIHFLYEAKLINAKEPVVDLDGADLIRANLNRADLREADLRKTDLREANLSEADLKWADLRWANLSGADLSNATYDTYTKWPDGFDPKAAGAINVED